MPIFWSNRKSLWRAVGQMRGQIPEIRSLRETQGNSVGWLKSRRSILRRTWSSVFNFMAHYETAVCPSCFIILLRTSISMEISSMEPAVLCSVPGCISFPRMKIVFGLFLVLLKSQHCGLHCLVLSHRCSQIFFFLLLQAQVKSLLSLLSRVGLSVVASILQYASIFHKVTADDMDVLRGDDENL